MNTFINDDFLLQNEVAKKLYHDYAAKLPIIDYHCHISPQQIAEDINFKNLTEVWLYGDHYKWRAMRTNGIAENEITGDVSDREKFNNWAKTVPYTLRNPLYHWTHLELNKPFGIKKVLNPETAEEIWNECNEKLSTPEFSCKGLIKQANVEVICTTDDPVDSLEYHLKIKESGFETKVLPTWRADKAMAIDNLGDFNAYVDKLAEVAGISIESYDDMVNALQIRQDFFAEMGCKLSDHGLDRFFCEEYTMDEIKAIFAKARKAETLTAEEIDKYKSAVLYQLAVMDHNKGWTQQFHIGAIRNNNTFMYNKLGADTGF